jgi:hypothetical protein
MVAQGDKDGDKELSKDEFTALADTWFGKFDPSGADKLNQEQLTTGLRNLFPASAAASASQDGASPGRQGAEGAVPSLSPEVLAPVLFGATDADKDGVLTRAEFKQAFAKWFDDWDTAKTGKLDQEAIRKGLETALPRSALRVRAPEAVARPAGSPPSAASDNSRAERMREDRTAERPTLRPSASDSARTREPAVVAARSTGGPGLDTFQIITDRNIFNLNRRARARNSGEEEKPKVTETLTLVGTLVYDKGPYAFFDGSGADKVVEPGGTVAGYKLGEVSGNGVKLVNPTNTVELRVGMQLRREEGGEWQVVPGSGPQTVSSSTSSSSSSDSSSSDDDNDIVKRLMKQREQELK